MKVLVIGGSGFIGEHLIKGFERSKDHTIANCDFVKPSSVYSKWYQCSVFDTDLFDHAVGLFKPDAIILLAGASNVDKTTQDPIGTIENGIMSVAKVADICRRCNIKLIYASSYFAVESSTGQFYTAIKRASERLIKNYHEVYGLEYVILRYGTVYGENCRGVMREFAEAMKECRDLAIGGTGDQMRHFIHVDDVVDATILAMEKISNKTLTIAPIKIGLGTSILELASMFIGSNKAEIVFSEARANDFRGGNFQTLLDAQTTQSLLDWKPKVTLEEGIRRMMQ